MLFLMANYLPLQATLLLLIFHTSEKAGKTRLPV